MTAQDATAAASLTPNTLSGPGTERFRQAGRIVEKPPGQRPVAGSIDEILQWLMGDAKRMTHMVELLDELCWRLVSTGMPIARATLHVPTIHPQLFGSGARWERATGRTEENLVARGIRTTDFYIKSPMRVVFDESGEVRCRLEAGPPFEFRLYEELRASGLTDYIALPIQGVATPPSARRRPRYGATYATDRPGGFTEAEIAAIRRIVGPLGLHIEIHATRQLAANIVDAYLGPYAGQRVLAGEIERGQGESTRAVVWCSDLREFTALTDRLPGERTIAILNAYFESMVIPIQDRGGEVLKFMGDGLLAVFPIPDAELAMSAAEQALDAARAALAGVAALADLPPLAPDVRLRTGIALHVGEVFYGNIGSSDRLDFTVIGPAVNVASRLEQLSKKLGRPLLCTAEFARAYRRPLETLGRHSLRGVAQPVDVFVPPA